MTKLDLATCGPSHKAYGALGLFALLGDISSERIHALLPLYLVSFDAHVRIIEGLRKRMRALSNLWCDQ
jgi:hypothetical protein